MPRTAEENILIERMEIKLQKDSIFNFSKIKPFSREGIIPAIESNYRAALALDSIRQSLPDSVKLAENNISRFTRVDIYNMRRALSNSLEWVNGDRSEFKSRRPWGKSFYSTPGTLFEVHAKDFD
ncbi:MAG TPA: hypothetical protein VFP87_05810, partial [Chitinophagaceae bacterium]|nr:hypothetical protein [Chitinophagaceae bacterium]